MAGFLESLALKLIPVYTPMCKNHTVDFVNKEKAPSRVLTPITRLLSEAEKITVVYK